ncbi:hypothetical protein [Sporosarcina sp. Te-1]|uniref:hypothetical protein n=1 Tax=Sporosarcina sp. Te-1 TaxID=2818390 RepID=UPI001A9CBF3B|nr:hypothetical protein [Sporosarcina sp. Te-1]QTD42973.1 hypothetical protein J3U78_09635 [Sporosarcina sp. Te-1]
MITIALFGSEETVTLVKRYEKRIEQIEIQAFCYRTVADLEELLPQATHCDVYLFSGILPYVHAERLVQTFDKPAVYIADNELNVSLTLLSVVHHRLASLDRISIDLPDQQDLDIIIEQLQIDPEPKYVTDFAWVKTDKSKAFQMNPILDFHLGWWKAGKTDLAITSIHAVYDQLVHLGVPSLRMVDAEKTILDALKDAKHAGILQKTELSQVAVSTMAISPKEKEHDISPSDLEPLFTGLQELAKQVNGTVQQLTSESFVFYGTRGGIEFLMEHLELLDPVLSIAEQLSVYLHLGSGFGLTLVDAKNNATIALAYAQKQEAAHSFIVVTEDKTVINPQDTMDQHVLSTNDEQIILSAKTLKISVMNVIKMIQFLKSRPVNRFTSGDIADYFGITKRSAERMLKKYMDVGWLEVIGEEQPFQNGRPRSIYRLHLPLSYS